MSGDVMVRVAAEDAREGERATCDIYTDDGALLVSEGQVVPSAAHAAVLLADGWRRTEADALAPPAAAAEDAPGPPPATARLPARPRPSLTAATALVADDMRLMRELLLHMLRDQGLTRIETVDNGRKAISFFFRHQPHLVFLDIDMPLIDGLAALRRIKQWAPDTFVCMVSGNSTPPNVREAKALGVDAFLVKPINALSIRRVLALYGADRVSVSP